jgi:hypothetical protein
MLVDQADAEQTFLCVCVCVCVYVQSSANYVDAFLLLLFWWEKKITGQRGHTISLFWCLSIFVFLREHVCCFQRLTCCIWRALPELASPTPLILPSMEVLAIA